MTTAPKSSKSQKTATRKSVAKKVDDFANLKRLVEFDRNRRYPKNCKKPRYVVVGTDEVGRGCLAGPVVAAAVVLPDLDIATELGQKFKELNDSKKVLPAKREELAAVIKSVSIFAIEQATVQEIEDINILQASLLAMRRALDKVMEQMEWTIPYLVLIDGNKALPEIIHDQQPVIGGDSTSASIAAASIIAKVHRDKLMKDLSEDFPHYGWHQNKGYGSRTHWDALREHGITHWHRKLFCSRLFMDEDGSEVGNLELESELIEEVIETLN